MPLLTGVAHISLTVRNLEISEKWYGELFGLSVVDREQTAHGETVRLADRSCPFEISLCRHDAGVTARFDESRTGLDHVSFGVPDLGALEDWERRLTERQIEHSPIAETPFGAVLVFRDPDHIQLELCTATTRRAAPGRPAG